jgi:RNA polymerase sigma-70 factor (ECF subfamily)
LYRVANRLKNGREDTEDLVGDTLMLAARGWNRFDGKHLKGWLVKIMMNRHLDDVRRNSSRIQATPIVDDTVPDVVDTWKEVSWRLDADRLIEYLQTMPEQFRMAVHLCDIESLSYEEAASALDIPIGTVRSRLSRGRDMLRARMKLGS